MKAVLLLCLAGLISACGLSSRSISIVGPTPPTLTSISVGPTNITLAVGARRQFTATGLYSDGSRQDISTSVTWTSATAAVASISNVSGSNGVVTAAGAGSTVITATLGTLSGTTTLTVTSSTLVRIGVTPASPTIANGTTQQFTATGVYSDNSVQNLTAVVTWHAVNPAVASITTAAGSGGLATGVGPGTTQITATLNGIVGTTNLTVTAATLVSIAVTPSSSVIRLGATQQYLATGHFSDLTTQDLTSTVIWTSSTGATAMISNASPSQGLATGEAPGTTLITAASGSITSTAVTLTVASALAYAANFGSNDVSQFFIGTDGTLTAIGTTPTVSAGNQPYSLVVDSSGKYVYVANYNFPGTSATTISQFAIGADGSLSVIGTGSVAATGFGPNGITVNPTKPYLYTANFNSDDISQYTIGMGGALTPAGATTPAGPGAASIALNPAGTFAYVANYSGNNISQYSVSPTDGSLTILATAPAPAGSNPNGVVVDPSGQYVYVPNNGDGTVSQYKIGSDGTLTAIPGAVTSGTGSTSGPWSVTVDSAGQNAYVANRGDDSVSHFSITAGTGALVVVGAPLTLAPGSGPTSVAIDPSGRFAYIADRGPDAAHPSSTISQCSVGADGSLTLLTPSTVAAGTAPAAIITAR